MLVSVKNSQEKCNLKFSPNLNLNPNPKTKPKTNPNPNPKSNLNPNFKNIVEK